MKRKIFIIQFLLWIIVSTSPAAVLSGKVVDEQKLPIASVSVVTNVNGVGTQTGSDGQFMLVFPDSATRVTFSCIGYQTSQFKISSVPSEIILSSILYQGKDIIVRSDRAQEGISPVSFTNVSSETLKRDYKIGEFPLLLETTPNLHAYSDGGGVLGYSYMSIRGFSDKQINTYINGVPLNDPEDQSTYFVDLPDFASTVTDIQVQRGVGNSLYGDASFGGSINIATNAFAGEQQVKLTTGYGQYRAGNAKVGDISKQSIEYRSGLINSRWQFAGRFSKQRSGGYRENSWYNGWAYYFSIARLDPRMTTEFRWYGGPMKMHLAYYGAEKNLLDSLGRRFNPFTYSNETDNFNQPHYQLHNIYKFNDKTTLSNTFYFIHGNGYYEQFKDDRHYSDYNIDSTMYSSGGGIGNLVRQQCVYKNQIGWNPRLDMDHSHGTHSLGGSFYYFNSDHWGQVVWAQNINGHLSPQHKYYQYYGKKWVGSCYFEESFKMSDNLISQATAQIRYQRYKFNQDKMGAFKKYSYDVDWFFVSPRLGLNYSLSTNTSLFSNIAVSSRTPTDAEIYDAGDPDKFPSLVVNSKIPDGNGDTLYVFGDPTAKNERVIDWELGGRYRTSIFSFGANFFLMDFHNEIIKYGGINPNNNLEMTINVDRSIHSGFEFTGTFKPDSSFSLSGNFALNNNTIKKYSKTFPFAVGEFADSTPVDFKNATVPGFPGYLANFITDYQTIYYRLTLRTHFVGKQYLELHNIEKLAIKPYSTASISATLKWPDFLHIGNLAFTVTVNNVFNKKFYASGYGYNYAEDNSGEISGRTEYFVGAERNFYSQFELMLF